jgi:outer membrane protein assembly factor BamB
LAVILSVLLAAPAAAQATFPDTIPLPDGFAPEGIAKGRGPTMYTGSLAGQGVYAFDVRTGEGDTVIEGIAGQPFVGMKFDARSGYLFVAGGPTGKAFVFDTETGEEVASFQLAGLGEGGTVPEPESFINDVVVTRDAAYFTDSFNPRLFVLPLEQNGRVDEDTEPVELPLTGDWEQGEGFGANGITATPNGKTLIVVHSGTGTLYTVDPATGLATEIDLGGDTVTMGDGILLSGLTLYVVRNRANEIAVVRLSPDFATGEIVETLTNENFRVPTTIAHFGRALYAVNARFGEDTTADPTFEAVRVEK